MKLRYFGHAAVGIESDEGTRLIVDPYEAGGLRGAISYRPIDWRADYAVCTHDHDDHSAVASLPGPPRPLQGEREVGPFSIRRWTYHHDEYEGAQFGGTVDVLRIDVEGIGIVHASDVGESPGGRLPAELRDAAVVLMPVGGFYTVGAAQASEWVRRLQPRCVVPTHYATSGTDLGLSPLENFLAHASEVVETTSSVLGSLEQFPSGVTSVVPLKPECAPSSCS